MRYLILCAVLASCASESETQQPFGFTSFGLSEFRDTDGDGLPDVRVPVTASAAIDRVKMEVMAATRAFEAAENALDADALIAWLDHDFYIYQDGARGDRQSTVAQIEATMPTLRSLETRFDDVEVTPLAADAALVSMTFHDVITAADGTVRRTWGPTTMLWRLREGGWRIAYVDADHYPVDAAADE